MRKSLEQKKETGKRPTHRLKVKSRESSAQTIVGAGWQNEDESISIHIYPAIMLTHELTKEHMITLFPIGNDQA